jgi:hypothetical protein
MARTQNGHHQWPDDAITFFLLFVCEIVAQKDEAGIATRAWPLKCQLIAALCALRGLSSSVHGLVVADGLGLGIELEGPLPQIIPRRIRA